MSGAPSVLQATIDARLGGVLLANMLAGWLDGDPKVLPTAETADELEDRRTSPEQTGLHLSTPVNPWPSTPPSGEHPAPVCTARVGTGLERIPDPHPRPGLGKVWDRNGGARGLQDLGCGCLHGSGGRGVCLGSLATGPLQPRLASTVGAMCAHRNPGDRRRWLLRSGGLQRRIVARLEGDNGAGRVTFFARPPPGRQAQQSQERRVAFPPSGRFLLR